MSFGRNKEENVKLGKHGRLPGEEPSSVTRLKSADNNEGITAEFIKYAPQQPVSAYQSAYGSPNGQPGFSGLEETKNSRFSTGAKVGIAFGIVIAVLALVYLVGVFVFSGRVFPNTKMGTTDISLMSTDELRTEMNNATKNYKLTLSSSNGFTLIMSASDIGLESVNSSSLKDMVPDQNPWAWPVEITKSHNLAEGSGASYVKTQIDQVVSSAVDAYNATAQMPVDAKLTYNSGTKAFTITPETTGTALDKTLVANAAAEAVAAFQTRVVLDNTYLLKPTIVSTDTRLVSAQQAAQKMVGVNVTYTIGGSKATVLDADVVGPMITLDANFTPQLDSDMLSEWANNVANALCTVGSSRTYTRPDGKVCTVKGGVYGWEVDAETFANQVRADAAEGATKTVAIACESEGNGFTAIGSQDWGARYIDVDLSEQHVRFYDTTGLIWEADCVSGSTLTEGHATPQGVWYVNAKESPSTLIGYKENGEKEYETKVQFWMPFEGNGVGFHDATWQPGFGGELYKQGYGSHGCINLSYSSAESLYGIITQGDVVVVHE